MHSIRLLLIGCLLLMGSSIFAQSTAPPQLDKSLRDQSVQVRLQDFQHTGFEQIGAVNVPRSVHFRDTEEEIAIGTTLYDLQTNNSTGNRLSGYQDSRAAVWTMGFLSNTSFPDRGSGYNTNASGDWQAPPTTRLESNTRVGWPEHAYIADGGEFIVAHSAPSLSTNRLHTLRKAPGSDTWVEADIPTRTPNGTLWPRAVSGGTDGNTIHVIAITPPVNEDNGVGPYRGMSQHPLYYRSVDGGETWDLQDYIIPGLDTSYYSIMGADEYAIHARGNTVAVAVFPTLGDAAVYKSTDNGDSWERHVIKDFPIDGYQIDDGYSLDTLPLDTLAPEGAINTTDGSGAVLIGYDGQVHAWMGNWYMRDTITDDESFFIFPGTGGGIQYWNESHGADSLRSVTFLLDQNGNGTFDITGNVVNNIGSYGVNLTGQPSVGLDQQGTLYLAYSNVMESDLFFNDEDQQHYRQLYMMRSEDGGETWTGPAWLINEATQSDEDEELIPFIEAVYPSMLKDNGENVELIYQKDFRPGFAVGDSEDDPFETNTIAYLSIDPEEAFMPVSTQVVTPQKFELTAMPNPAHNKTLLQWSLPAAEQVQLGLYDMTGRQVMQLDKGLLPSGTHHQVVDLRSLPQGVYLLRMQADRQVTSMRIVVR